MVYQATSMMGEGYTPPTPLERAEQAVRDYCGWHVAPVVTETLTLDGPGDPRVFLPSLKVLAISAVRVSGDLVDPSGYTWTADGVLRRLTGTWPYLGQAIEVDLEHGHNPAEVAWIVGQVAERIEAAPAGASVLSRATVGQRQLEFRPTAGMVGLLAAEREALAPYRIIRGVAR